MSCFRSPAEAQSAAISTKRPLLLAFWCSLQRFAAPCFADNEGLCQFPLDLVSCMNFHRRIFVLRQIVTLFRHEHGARFSAVSSFVFKFGLGHLARRLTQLQSLGFGALPGLALL